MDSMESYEDLISHLEQEDHRATVRLAWRLGLGVPVLTLLTLLVFWLITGDSVATHIAPIVVALVGVVGTCVITSRKWSRYHAWAPLMGAVWALVPWFLLVATTLLPKLILGE
jgi:hypothetical protein